MKVKATKTGFIFCTLMKKGDEFTLKSEDQYSSLWMEKIEDVKEEKPATKSAKTTKTTAKKKAN